MSDREKLAGKILEARLALARARIDSDREKEYDSTLRLLELGAPPDPSLAALMENAYAKRSEPGQGPRDPASRRGEGP